MIPALMAGVGSGMQLASTFFGKGSKVKVPDYYKVDPSKVQQETISGNLASTSGAQELANRTNIFNQEQVLNMLRSAIPGYDQLQKKQGQTISSMLAGEIPEDVSRSVWDKANAKALGGGMGEGMKRNLVARDLGLTSLQLTQQGLDAASRWIQTTKATATAPLFDSSSMFFTPMQRAGIDVQQNQFAWNAQLAKATENAKPDPKEAALSQWLNQTGGMMAGAGLMGMAGGGGSSVPSTVVTQTGYIPMGTGVTYQP